MSKLNQFRPKTKPTLTDVLGGECCQPTCHAPASDQIASQVPLCEAHIFDVYKSVNRLLAVQGDEHEYALLPMEQHQIPGPCPSCGVVGYLAQSVVDDVRCLNASCRFRSTMFEFERLRRTMMFALAGERSVVYYIKFRDCVKIGTSTNLRNRAHGLQTIDMLYGFEWGGRTLERRRHGQFAAYHAKGEWFEDNRQLRAHINNVCVTAA